jgi:hypothetical protein
MRRTVARNEVDVAAPAPKHQLTLSEEIREVAQAISVRPRPSATRSVGAYT